MKKFILSLAVMAGTLTLASCGGTGTSNSVLGSVGSALLQGALTNSATTSTTSSTTTTSTSTSLLGSLLSNVLGSSSTLTQSSLVGTWKYTGASCVFESENLLAKAGGAVASNQIESKINTQLAKVGIKEGTCSFTFNSDGTYSATIGTRSISGNYTLDSSNKTIKMTYLGGLGSMTPHVSKTGSNLSLLIESDKLLTLLKGASALSGSSSLSTISSLLGNYDGLYLGLQLSK